MSILARMFNKKAPLKSEPITINPVITTGFIKPCSATELLASPRRQKLLTYIWQRTSVSREQFELLYLKPIERYAELVQQFPASEAHHHAYPGGLLDHGLEIIAYALKLRQSYLLPIGSTPEEQAAQAEIWTAATAYAALLHDIGKIAVDLYIEYENGQIWHPWHGPLTRPYRFKYNKDREYRLHTASSGLLYNKILDNSIMDWLSQTPEIWSSLLYILSGHFEHGGVLGDIITKADQSSVAQELGGDPAKAMAAPKHALQRKLLDGLRYLLKSELKLNTTGPSDAWLTDDALWLVSKTVSDKLRAHLLSQGISGIPSKNSAIFDILQEHGILQATSNGKAIWSANIKSNESGWGNKFTFLKLSPSLIWESGERPEYFNGTVTVNLETDTAESVENDNPQTESTINDSQPIPITSSIDNVVSADSLDAVFDILGIGDDESSPPVTHTEVASSDIPAFEQIVEPVKTKKAVTSPPPTSPELVELVVNPVNQNNDIMPSGEHFMAWLKDAILNQKLIINDVKALVHTVDNTLFIVTPGIFTRYATEFPKVQQLAKAENIEVWLWVQKRFEKQQQHKKQVNGLNIWTCQVTGPHRTNKVHGYLLANPELILPEISFNNPYLKLLNIEEK